MAGTATSYFGDTIGFNEPYFEGSSTVSTLVPGLLDIAIGGHAYMAETSFTPFKQDAYRSDSIEAVADKTDITNIPGEAAVNTQGLWRREMQDFSAGAGQLFLDRRQSQDNRFYKSKGIYPWTQWYATLMNDVAEVHNSGNELQVLTVANYVYINDGGTVRYSTGDLSSWSAVAGVTANLTNNALTTDGYNLYIACGSSGIYIITTPGSTASSWVTGTVNSIWYAGGNLVCATGASLYEITTGTGTTGSLPSPLLTVPNVSFVWSSCASGNSWLYISGYSSTSASNTSIVYKTQQNSTGTGLIVPIVAATLPGGEVVYSLYAYANFIMVGTSLGSRFCETLGINDPGGNAGDLKMGPIVPDQIQQVTKPVRAFVGQFRWVWFGWSNYDAVSTGLGRQDLSTFIDQQAPAYTSDLMVTGNGEVMSMDWYNGLNNITGLNTGSPIFVIGGQGVYTAASTFVSSGIIDTGYITYGLPDDKIALLFDYDASGTAGAVQATITVDNGDASYLVAPQFVANALSEVSLPSSLKGELFDVQIELTSGSSNTVTPTLTRFMMKALPCVVSGTIHKVIVNLFATEETNAADQRFYAYQEFAFLDGLRRSKTPVQFQEGTQFNITVVINSITRLIYSGGGLPEGGFNQRLEVELQSLED
jgi:hypothetical protein